MSCMIMNPEPLAAIANAAETLLNCGYEYFGFGATHQMHDAFQDCRIGYSYDAEGIYKKLYAVNVAAYNGRYKDHETPADETAPTIDGSRYKVHQRPEYAEHHHAVRPWHYRLAKLLDFWLYQTGEDATWNDPTRAAMVDFQKALFEFIVQRSSEYDNAPAWGEAVTQSKPARPTASAAAGVRPPAAAPALSRAQRGPRVQVQPPGNGRALMGHKPKTKTREEMICTIR